MTRTVWIKVELPDDKAAILEGPAGVAMVLPMLEGEVVPFGAKLNALGVAITFFRRGLSTLRQVLKRSGDRDGHISKTLDQMSPAVADAEVLIDDVRVMIGQAVFVGKLERKGPVQ